MRVLSILLLAIPVAQAGAHAIWVAQRAGDAALVMGHGPEDLPYDEAKVTRWEAFTASGDALPIAPQSIGGNLRLPWREPLAAMIAEFEPGPWVKLSDGRWRRGRLASGEQGTEYEYQRYNLHLFRAGVAVERLPKQTLRLAPVTDPFTRQASEMLVVRLLDDGKPRAGVPVYRDYVGEPNVVSATTAADGSATVEIRNEGLNVIVAALEGDNAQVIDRDGRSVTVVRSASLSFVLPFVHDGRKQDVFERRAAD